MSLYSHGMRKRGRRPAKRKLCQLSIIFIRPFFFLSSISFVRSFFTFYSPFEVYRLNARSSYIIAASNFDQQFSTSWEDDARLDHIHNSFSFSFFLFSFFFFFFWRNEIEGVWGRIYCTTIDNRWCCADVGLLANIRRSVAHKRPSNSQHIYNMGTVHKAKRGQTQRDRHE